MNYNKIFFYINTLMLIAWGYAIQSLDSNEILAIEEINGSNIFFIIIPILAPIAFYRYLQAEKSAKIEWLVCIASVGFAIASVALFFN